ncbi:FAD-dependent oxidoreductase [Kordia jejudonensis]|uniref:FAD-dependent oxidoreductase n=1 Tax=Kordia jejudonensis TaxID=1348245 RepID=UPI0006290B3A|nr:FAD-dependent oxidoreductase [Kordia jejudonensis]
MFDVLIIGGGVSGMQCALVLGSAKTKPFAVDKKMGIILHQRSSHLQNALFNNVLGLPEGKTGAEILQEGRAHLQDVYPHVLQIEKEKVIEISGEAGNFQITTNKNTYQSKIVVIALNYAKPFTIEGLEEFIAPHPRAAAKKDRIYLKNEDHLVTKGLYVCGTIAGWRSQFAIAAGSGAQVATDILTLWNDGNHTKVHDKI